MDREEDHDLIRRMRSADRVVAGEAFETLYNKYRDRVFNLSCRILNDRNLAADATQATFLAVFRKHRRFDCRSAFTSWLYRVAVNQCLDLRRRRGRITRLSLDDPEVEGAVGDQDRRRTPVPGPEEAAGRAELARRLGEVIAGMSPRLGPVLVLRYVEGLSYEEIAEILDLPVGTVKSRLSRAHLAVQAELGESIEQYL